MKIQSIERMTYQKKKALLANHYFNPPGPAGLGRHAMLDCFCSSAARTFESALFFYQPSPRFQGFGSSGIPISLYDEPEPDRSTGGPLAGFGISEIPVLSPFLTGL